MIADRRMLKHMPYIYGPEGLIIWLAEVQHFTRLMRCRTLDGCALYVQPLRFSKTSSSNERDHIEMYVAYWRQRRGGAVRRTSSISDNSSAWDGQKPRSS